MSYQWTPPPQSVAPGYAPVTQPAYANWLYRVGAYLIDGLVNGAVFYVAAIVIAVLTSAASAGAAAGGSSSATTGVAVVALILYLIAAAATLGITIWNIFLRQGQTGQSLGKQALGIRLVSLQTGQPIGAGMAFLRYLCHFVDAIACYIGFLWPLWDDRRQTFADKIVGSVVVRSSL